MQRNIRLGGKKLIGFDGAVEIVRLQRHHHVFKIQLFQNIGLFQGFVYHDFGPFVIGQVHLSGHAFEVFDRTGIDADAYGHAFIGAGFDHLFGVFYGADIARVNAHLVYALFDGFQRQFVIKMNIGHQRAVYAFFNFAQGQRGLHVRHGHAVDFAAGVFQHIDLGGGGGGVARVGVTHALHAHGLAGAQGIGAYLHKSAFIHYSPSCAGACSAGASAVWVCTAAGLGVKKMRLMSAYEAYTTSSINR